MRKIAQKSSQHLTAHFWDKGGSGNCSASSIMEELKPVRSTSESGSRVMHQAPLTKSNQKSFLTEALNCPYPLI